MTPLARLAARLAPAALALSVLVGCSKEKPKEERWAAAEEKAASATPTAVARPDTGVFTKYFPDDSDGLRRAFRADKPGYAEAIYGEDLVISITVADDAAKARFKGATEQLSGFPVTDFGKSQTSALVGGRYQVKVAAKGLDPAARRKWLGRMDLAGIASVPVP